MPSKADLAPSITAVDPSSVVTSPRTNFASPPTLRISSVTAAARSDCEPCIELVLRAWTVRMLAIAEDQRRALLPSTIPIPLRGVFHFMLSRQLPFLDRGETSQNNILKGAAT